MAQGDLPVIMGTVVLGTVVVLFASLIADILNAMLDPRIREQSW